jgi:lysophospholipase L1-like esterase
MKSKLFYFVILSQLALISFLGFKVNQKRKNVLGSVEINPITKDNINFKPTKKLKYFYEPEASKQYLYRQSSYTINKDALHETHDYTIEKPKNVFRIITLGDSFTFGLFVEDNENWPKQLEQILDQKCQKLEYEVINLGMEGYDIEYALERYKTRGAKYNPDLILWLHVDFLRNREKMQPFLKKYSGYKNENDPYYAWRLGYQEYTKAYPEEEIIQYQKQLLKNYAKEVNIPTTMFVLSSQSRYFSIFEELSNNNSKIYSKIINYNDSMRIPGDGHPSEYGHQVIAQDVYEYLIKNKLVPCN